MTFTSITWGSGSGSGNPHYVGISYQLSGTTLTVRYYVKATYTVSDDQTLTLTGAITGTVGYRKDGAGEQLITTRTRSVSAGGSYTVTAAASGIYNGGTPSESRTINVPAAVDPPDAPGGTAASVSDGHARLSWNAAGTNGTPVTGYRVQIATNSSFTANVGSTTVSASTRAYTFTSGDRPGTTYYMRVRADSAAGYGPWGTVRSTTVPAKPPAAPGGTTASLSNGQPRIEWAAATTNGTPVTGYQVQRALNNGFTTGAVATTVGSTVRGYTATATFDPGTTVYMRVRANSSAGYGPWSTTRSVTTPTSPLPPLPPDSPSHGALDDFTSRSKEALVAGALRHLLEVTYSSGEVGGILDVENASITFDEGWSPHVQAGITCRVPDDQDLLDHLDPRAGCRIGITMGYRFADGTEETTTLDLGLCSRVVGRPDNTMTLMACSDEMLLQNAVRFTQRVPSGPPLTGVRECLDWVFANGLPYTPTVVWGIGEEYGASTLVGLEVPSGTPFWDVATSATDPTDIWVYDDGTRRFQVRPRPTNAGSSSHQVFVGPVGNLIGSETSLSLNDGYANAVILQHEWTSGEDRKSLRRGAWVSSGDYSVGASGMRAITVTKATKTSAASIEAAVQRLLRRAVTRGRSMNLVTPSPYWVRPGQTITAQLPLGPQERHLVASVNFRFPSGECSIHTRVPNNVTITTGE